MKKKIISGLLSVVMATTVFFIPGASVSHGTLTGSEQDIENVTAQQSETDEAGELELFTDGVEALDIKDAEVKFASETFVFDGAAIEPEITVVYNELTLEEGVDYEVSYSNNNAAGTGIVLVTGIGDYMGEKQSEFIIVDKERIDISKATVKFAYVNYFYTGEERMPEPVVKLGGDALEEGVDYQLSYSNNVYPGKGMVQVIGINNYEGTATGYFNIASVLKFKVKETGKDYIKLTWSEQKNVTGYKIYKYSTTSKTHKLYKTVKGTSVTLKGFDPGYGYSFQIRTYVKLPDGKLKAGTLSDSVYAVTTPDRVSLKSFTTSTNLSARVRWYKKASTGYQVQLSRYSNFSNAKKYSIGSSGTLTKYFTKLSDGKNYYVRVRAYKKYHGITKYGAWSKSKKIKTNGTGWYTTNGKKYYYRKGAPLKGAKTINGNTYYFSKSNNGLCLGASYEMWTKVRDEKSETQYLVAVDRKLNRTCVYQRQNGKWYMKYYWKCTTGASGTWTPRGNHTVPKTKTHLKSFGDKYTYVVWYATRFYKSCYFHSVLYAPGSMTKITDGRLGASLSHGCVRLAKDNAKWLYDNVHAGTKVVVY